MCKDPIPKQTDIHKDQDSDIFFGRVRRGNTTLPTIIDICYLEAFKTDDWRRKWQSTTVLLPGKSHGQRSLVGYSAWGRKESDMSGS